MDRTVKLTFWILQKRKRLHVSLKLLAKFNRRFHEEYGKIAVLSGIPFVKPIVLLFDTDAIEAVS